MVPIMWNFHEFPYFLPWFRLGGVSLIGFSVVFFPDLRRRRLNAEAMRLTCTRGLAMGAFHTGAWRQSPFFVGKMGGNWKKVWQFWGKPWKTCFELNGHAVLNKFSTQPLDFTIAVPSVNPHWQWKFRFGDMFQ